MKYMKVDRKDKYLKSRFCVSCEKVKMLGQLSPKLSIILLQITNVLGSGVFKISFCNML